MAANVEGINKREEKFKRRRECDRLTREIRSFRLAPDVETSIK